MSSTPQQTETGVPRDERQQPKQRNSHERKQMKKGGAVAPAGGTRERRRRSSKAGESSERAETEAATHRGEAGASSAAGSQAVSKDGAPDSLK